MRKIILSVGMLFPYLSFGISTMDMKHAMCKDMHLSRTTTLQRLRDNCRISEQETTSKGVFEVTINNDTTNKEIICSFPDKSSTAVLSSCR